MMMAGWCKCVSAKHISIAPTLLIEKPVIEFHFKEEMQERQIVGQKQFK